MNLNNRNRGLSLVEVVISMVLVLIGGLSVIGGIIYTRQSMERDKQRIAALNYCRQGIEAANSLDDVYVGTRVLNPFNAPGVEDLNAQISVQYFGLNPNGSVNWSDPRVGPPNEEPVYARVMVEWSPKGDTTESLSMSTVLMKGIL